MLKIYYILELIEKENFSKYSLLALGYTKNDIVNEFYEKETYSFDDKSKKMENKI